MQNRIVKKLLLITPIVISVIGFKLFAQSEQKEPIELKPLPEHTEISQFVSTVLERNHYQPIKLNDETGKKIALKIIDDFDPGKFYFIQSDVDGLLAQSNEIDNYFSEGNFSSLFNFYNLFSQRILERVKYSYTLLSDSFDYSAKDSFLIKREETGFAKSVEELNQIWYKKIKYEALSLQAGGKDWKNTSDILKTRYQRWETQLSKSKPWDAFSLIMGGLTGITDPHTEYYSPRESDDFNIQMSLSLEGIGATLQTDGEYTKVRDIVKGGPADKSKQIKIGDRITAVGQGKDSALVDVVGWRIDEVVSLIRGPKGTFVKLQILRDGAAPSSPQEIIIIKRDKIKLEDQAAKGEIRKIKIGKKEEKIGVITLPTFYMDFEGFRKKDPDYKSTTRDVQKIIEGFKKDKVKGIVLDLRNNGGGSLIEAINLTGLFIDNGPVVQVKNLDQSIDVESDINSGKVWDGPLAVLVNRGSASASEIFAAAIQDYNRGIIMGEKTFGKGTVQNLISLDDYISSKNKSGELKITVAKFYRINGSSTQLKGVMPDILFPGFYSSKEFGEEENEYALAWDQIRSAPFMDDGTVTKVKEQLISSSKPRVESNILYKNLVEDIAAVNEIRNKKYVTLNLEQFKKESAEAEAVKKAREEEQKALDGEDESKKDEKTKDLVLMESLNVLADWIKSIK